MKRQQFQITSTLGHDATGAQRTIKTTWNASIRHIERLAKELAVQDGADYHLTNSRSVKEAFEHVQGTREWTNSKTGAVVVFTIKKLED